MKGMQSPAELYAHAIAIEREAAQRYAEMAARMQERGSEAVAEVFAWLAQLEAEHLEALLARTEGIGLPELSANQYRWLDAGAPETAAHEFLFRLMTPRRALAVALAAEERAQAFFEHVLVTAEDPALRALAREMAIDEAEHARILQRLLEREPEFS